MTNPEDRLVKHDQAAVIELPNGSREKIIVQHKWTVRDFKVNCELQFGIPYNLQKLSLKDDPSVELNDWLQLREAVKTFGEVIVLQVPVWWNKFICASLNNEIENVYKRAKLSMQQISKEERLFVGLFIACCRGYIGLLEKLNTLGVNLGNHATTEAGRNLFHAVAVSGKSSCVEYVASHLVDPTKEILSMLDTNKETPLDLARRFKHHETERVLYKYMYHEKGEREERSSAESGIDLSEEFESIDLEGHSSDDANQETKSPCKAKQQEPGNDSSSEEDSPLHHEERQLVITECDDELSLAGAAVRRMEPPPDQVKIQINVIQNGHGTGDDPPSSDTSNLRLRSSSDTSSSESSEESSSPRPSRPRTLKLESTNQPLLQRRFGKGLDLYRPKSARLQRSQISVCKEEAEDEEEQNKTTYLPPLEGQTLVSQAAGNNLGSPASRVHIMRKNQAVVRTNSTPNSFASKQRLSPEEERSYTLQQPDNNLITSKSAPNSPKSPRIAFKPSVKPSAGGSISSTSPLLSRRDWDRRRGSEPFPAFSRNTNGTRLGFIHSRREAIITADVSGNRSLPQSPIIHRRGKSRSICEATLADTFRDMEEDERLDKPWNAWIAVRKESFQPMHQPTAPESPVSESSRRMTFQQWLSEKDLQHLRNLFASAQEAAKTNEKQAKLMKGKTFEEWLEDKRREIEREKEKERELEEQLKEEQHKKDRRRRMSQQKYERWLRQKDLGALQEEENQVAQAKQKLEIMKKKWEEQDQMKKNKRGVARSKSLPVEGLPIPSPSINRHGGSLQTTHKT